MTAPDLACITTNRHGRPSKEQLTGIIARLVMNVHMTRVIRGLAVIIPPVIREPEPLVSHQDQVIEPAAGSVVLAGSEFCPNAVCQLGDHILTFQGHPEFIKDYSRKLMDFRREMLGEQVYEDGMASLATDTDQRQVARWIIDFIRHGNGQAQRLDAV